MRSGVQNDDTGNAAGVYSQEGSRGLASLGQLNDRSASSLHVAGGHGAQLATPVRVELQPLACDVSADEAFSTVLATYASAIAENLRCVLANTDPEGPHQLRVTLRRLRTMLRICKPIVRRATNQRLTWFARYLGAIVGDLRDADVMIEDMFRPAIVEAGEGAPLLRALETWREDVRASVRASLAAARATAFTMDLANISDSGEWRRAKVMKKWRLAPLVQAALDATWTRAAPRGGCIVSLSAPERHELRKDVKVLRYSAELAAADADTIAFAQALKRLQTSLGYLNDLEMLAQFDPPLARERSALAALRERLLAERAKSAAGVATASATRWRKLESAMQVLRIPQPENLHNLTR